MDRDVRSHIVVGERIRMDISYAIMPFFTWLVAGAVKFLINSFKTGNPAFGLIGYGGFPSNHSAIASGMAMLIALREGIAHPAFGLAVSMAFIVIIDATSLRRQVGRHAMLLNQVADLKQNGKLRERIGHSLIEIAGGIVVGMLCAFVLQVFSTQAHILGF